VGSAQFRPDRNTLTAGSTAVWRSSLIHCVSARHGTAFRVFGGRLAWVMMRMVIGSARQPRAIGRVSASSPRGFVEKGGEVTGFPVVRR
jgi:hypothetical protein